MYIHACIGGYIEKNVTLLSISKCDIKIVFLIASDPKIQSCRNEGSLCSLRLLYL